MGVSFSRDCEYNDFRLLQHEDSDVLKDGDDILVAIKSAVRKINARIEFLEAQFPLNREQDVELAILLRQEQYFELLLQKSKTELEEIFFGKAIDNCIVPEILQWYTPQEE